MAIKSVRVWGTFWRRVGAAAVISTLAAPIATAQTRLDLGGPLGAAVEEVSALGEQISFGVENRFSGRERATERRFVAMRFRFSPGAAVEPYAGGGFGRAEDVFGDNTGGIITGRLIGGLAAPISSEMQLFGEYQHVRPIGRDRGFNRAVFGLRAGF